MERLWRGGTAVLVVDRRSVENSRKRSPVEESWLGKPWRASTRRPGPRCGAGDAGTCVASSGGRRLAAGSRLARGAGSGRNEVSDAPVTEHSLEQIDDTPWGDPPAGATRLVAAVHRLRRVPIGRLDTEALRLLI